MTKWAGDAYRDIIMERERIEHELARAGTHSMFYKAFLRAGSLVTANGEADDEIRPHDAICGELDTRFRAMLAAGIRQRRPSDGHEPFIIELSASEEEQLVQRGRRVGLRGRGR